MKAKTILFGAGSAGEKFINNNDCNQYDLIAISDNNPNIWGSTLCEIPIINPAEIAHHSFDQVIITSFWADSIQDQLINELNIPANKVIIAPKSTIKNAVTPFTDIPTLELARETMGVLSEYLISCNVNVYVDFGTLLGLIRDGDIIPWDDDIDFAVNEEDFECVVKHMKSFAQLAPKAAGLEWQVSVISRANNDTSIKIEFSQLQKKYNDFKIGIAKRRHIDGNSVLVGLGGMLYAPSFHFKDHEIINVFGYNFKTPSKPKEYLSFVYGDWKTPVKGMTFQDYNNRNIPSEMDADTMYTTSKLIS